MQVEVSDKRDSSRFRPRGMNCSLGQVVDLSATGLRVLSKKKLDGEQTVTIQDLNNETISVRGRVLWHRRHGVGELAPDTVDVLLEWLYRVPR